MISVIMPTMWQGREGIEIIRALNEIKSVGEIIVIDNTPDEIHLEDFKKVVHIREGRNTFVNPAWNKGYRLAKYDKLLFVNDDVQTDCHNMNLHSSSFYETIFHMTSYLQVCMMTLLLLH